MMTLSALIAAHTGAAPLVLPAGSYGPEKLNGVSNLTIDAATNNASLDGIAFWNSKAVTILGGRSSGMTFVAGSDIRLGGVHFTGGLYTQRLVGLTVEACLFHDTGGDCINIPGCRDVVIDGNAFWGESFGAGVHPDAIQSFNMAGWPHARVHIARNFIGGAMQGINLTETAGVLLEENRICVGFQNAVIIGPGSTDVHVRDNAISTYAMPALYASLSQSQPQATMVFMTGVVPNVQGANTIAAWGSRAAKTLAATPTTNPAQAPAQ